MALKIQNNAPEESGEKAHATDYQKNKAKIVFVEADIIHNLVILQGLGENRFRSITDLLRPDKTIRRFPYKELYYADRPFEGSRALGTPWEITNISVSFKKPMSAINAN